MLEAEIQTETLQEVMNLVEDMIRTLTSNLQKSDIFTEVMSSNRTARSDLGENLDFPITPVQERWDGLLRKSWPQITYAEAVRQLKEAVRSDATRFQHEPSAEEGLQIEHERFLVAEIGQGSPIFITKYPQKIKPFYMLPAEKDQGFDFNATAECFDLLLPDVYEVVGGSMREHRYSELAKSMEGGTGTKTGATALEIGTNENTPSDANQKNLDWYLDLRRFGSVPHGGFGLGLDRLIGYFAGVYNIKDVVAWPRWYRRCDS